MERVKSSTSVHDAERILKSGGDAREALRILENLPAEQASNHRSLLAKGIALFRLKKYSDAERVFDQVCSFAPTNVVAHYFRGMCLETRGSTAEATRAYAQCLTIEPDNSTVLKRMQSLQGAHLRQGSNPERETIPRPAKPPSGRTDTEFYVPETDGELQRFRERKIAKERALFFAQWHGTPPVIRFLQVTLIALFFVGFVGVGWFAYSQFKKDQAVVETFTSEHGRVQDEIRLANLEMEYGQFSRTLTPSRKPTPEELRRLDSLEGQIKKLGGPKTVRFLERQR